MPLLFWLDCCCGISTRRRTICGFGISWHDRIGWFDGFGWLRGLRLPDRFILPDSLVPPFGEFALRLLNIEDVGHITPPNFGEFVSRAITGHIQRQRSVAGMGDVLAKLDFCPP